jgi:hypothetical protein
MILRLTLKINVEYRHVIQNRVYNETILVGLTYADICHSKINGT